MVGKLTPQILENVRNIRPGFGLHPKCLSELLGKEFNQDIDKITPLSLKDINNYEK